MQELVDRKESQLFILVNPIYTYISKRLKLAEEGSVKLLRLNMMATRKLYCSSEEVTVDETVISQRVK